MEFVPNQNLTSGSQPEVKAWDSAAQPVIAGTVSLVVYLEPLRLKTIKLYNLSEV